MPDTYQELLNFFMERDTILAVLLACIVVVVSYMIYQLERIDKYFNEKPEAKAAFEHWDKHRPKESKTSCPVHGLWVPPGKSCYAKPCKWRRDEKGNWIDE